MYLISIKVHVLILVWHQTDDLFPADDLNVSVVFENGNEGSVLAFNIKMLWTFVRILVLLQVDLTWTVAVTFK